MAWRINNLKNDLPISDELTKAIAEHPHNHGTIKVTGGKLYFDPEHMEWRDYIRSNPWLRDLLIEHKVTGETLWSASDGDDRGRTWGHRFVDGQYTELTRRCDEWVEDTGEEPEELTETGVAPIDLRMAKRGDTVAVGFIFMGLTSWERGVVADILQGGDVLIVDGKEFAAPGYRFRDPGDVMGSSFRIAPVTAPGVQLDEEEA